MYPPISSVHPAIWLGNLRPSDSRVDVVVTLCRCVLMPLGGGRRGRGDGPGTAHQREGWGDGGGGGTSTLICNEANLKLALSSVMKPLISLLRWCVCVCVCV